MMGLGLFFLQFCHDLVNFVIEITLIVSIHKKEGKCFRQYSVFTQPVQLFVFVWFFCLYGVKILVLFQRKGPQKEKKNGQE